MAKTTLKIHNFPVQLLFYFILIPFVYPRGFASFFGWYKAFFTLWLLAALGVIFILLCWVGYRRQLKLKSSLYWIIAYFAVFLIETLIDQQGINDGLQKLFAAPLLCIFTMEALKEYRYTYISCLANIFLVEFGLALTVCSPLVMKGYFSEASHMLFLGHVQMASQFGIMGVLLSYFLYRLYPGFWRPALLLGSSLLIMATSGTIASYIAILILVVGILLARFGQIRSLVSHPCAMFWIYLLLCAFLFAAAWLLESSNYRLMGVAVDLNGRMYIWAAGFALMAGHWLLGYGAYGAWIHTFWNTGTARMNYAHSQVLQCLLDGGIPLTILFYWMVWRCCKEMTRTPKRYLYFPSVCLFAFLMIMVIESVTEYLYFYIFLIMMAYLPEISRLFIRRPSRIHIEF